MKMNTIVFLAIFSFSHLINGEYKYYGNVGKHYKFHKAPMKWVDARLLCISENATLAMPKNDLEADILKSIFEEHPKSNLKGVTHPDYILIAFHDMFSETEFITDKGEAIQYFYHTWADNQPDNLKEEDCGSLHRGGKLNDYPCGTPGVFVCQKSDNHEYPNNKYIEDSAYELEPTSKKSFKLHLNPKTWAEARTICHSEGGKLAMINSKQEEEFLVKIFNEPKNKINHVKHRDYALLGFQDIFKEGQFFTVSGDELRKSPYVKWRPGQPDNSRGNENCGSMHKDGRLNDFPCHVPAIFFCEVEANALLGIDIRFDVSH